MMIMIYDDGDDKDDNYKDATNDKVDGNDKVDNGDEGGDNNDEDVDDNKSKCSSPSFCGFSLSTEERTSPQPRVGGVGPGNNDDSDVVSEP